MTNILNLPMPQPNDADATTIGDYLIKLLAKVWEENECFNGKRPFGNSGWDYDLYPPLIAAGLVSGELDEDDYIDTIDQPAAAAMIADAIQHLHVLITAEATQ